MGDGVTSIAVAGKHGKFYSASRDRSIKEWDVASLTNTMHTLHVHGDWVQALCQQVKRCFFQVPGIPLSRYGMANCSVRMCSRVTARLSPLWKRLETGSSLPPTIARYVCGELNSTAELHCAR